MTTSPPPNRENEEFWRDYLTHGSPSERRIRRIFRWIPQEPRCSLCAAPFGGIGAPVMRLIGKQQSDMSPRMCATCNTFLAKHHGGAEIECTFLFADVRGSTTLAEAMPSAEFHALMDRFYATATNVMFDHDGSVDKFVGDEVVAMFPPLLAGERHAAKAVEAGLALLRETGHQHANGPWLPVGAGVHTGMAWVGAVGEGAQTALTALGDTVNTTARLASAAQQGEVLVSTAAAAAADLDPHLDRRSLELKGKQLLTEVVTLTVTPSGGSR